MTTIEPGTHASTTTERSGLRHWPLGRHELGLVFGAYVALTLLWVGLGLLLTRVLDGVAPFNNEDDVNRWFERHRTPRWNDISLVGSDLSDTRVKILLVLAVGTAFAVAWRRWHESLQIAVALLLEVAVFGTVQQLVDRPRPPVKLLDGHLPTSSFPSGHVAASFAFYVGIAIVIFAHTRRTWARSLGVALAIIVPSIVAVSRLYRGMHHVSDVAAGALLGIAAAFVTQRILADRSEVGVD
jgi:undecaprenyl-diphosphatase